MVAVARAVAVMRGGGLVARPEAGGLTDGAIDIDATSRSSGPYMKGVITDRRQYG